jgi:hypothetical protein
MIRRELVCSALRELGSAVAVDRAAGRRRRSRVQHLRNGAGALLFAASDVAMRRGAVATAMRATRRPVRREVRYALRELAQARPRLRHRSHLTRRRVALLAGCAGAVAAAVTWSASRPGALVEEP